MTSAAGLPGVRAAIFTLLISASVHFGCFARWPGSPDWDVHHSAFAAQNFVRTGSLVSINLHPEYDDNLARQARLRWMTHWPPAHSWLYVVTMTAGLTAGASTKAIAALCVVVGGLGWIHLARASGGSRGCLVAIAVAYPWLSLIARLYLDYKNDHLACALAPWVYLCLMRIEPSDAAPHERWGRLTLAALLAGFTVVVKYSLIPIMVGSVVYLAWLDGRVLRRQRVLRFAVFCGLLLLPGVVLWLVNRAWTDPSYPIRPGEPFGLSFPVYVSNIVTNTFGSPPGWDLLFIQLRLLFGLQLFKGGIVVVSFCFAALWAVQFARSGWQGTEKRFGVFLCFSTMALWLMLPLMTMLSGVGYNYVSGNRFYLPIGVGWLVLCAVSVDKHRETTAMRSVLWASLAVPLAFSVAFFAVSGLRGTPFPAMPDSGTAWTETLDAGHAAVLSDLARARGRKPGLLVAPSGQFMTELGVPNFFTFRATRNDGREYFSSENLEVWAMVPPSEEAVLLSNFRRATRREQVTVPGGFPFVLYVFNFAP